MNFRRRLIFWIILGLFAGLTAAYLAWTPYRPADLYRAIPANAILVSSHQDLAGRWSAISSNAILRSLIPPAKSDQPQDTAAAMRKFQRLIRLARNETLIAYVPAAQSGGEPALIFASWIGSSSSYLRWALFLKPSANLARLPGYCNGRPIWKYRQPLTKSGRQLSVAFGDGIIFGCISRNPSAIRHVLLAYDGQAPSLPITGGPNGRPAPFAAQSPTGAPPIMDQGLFQWQPLGGNTSEPFQLAYAISRLEPEFLAAEISVRPALKPSPPLADTLELPACEQLLGDLPALLLILPLDIVQDLLAQAPAATPAALVWETLQSNLAPAQSNNVILALLDGEYGGGIGQEPFRLRLPALLICLKVNDPGAVKPMVGDLADKLNNRYQLGLRLDPKPLPAGNLGVITLETTQPNLFFEMASEDRPAYAVIGQWLLVSSNARSLIKLLERYQNPEAGRAAAARWKKPFASGQPAALLWMDLDVCGRALQLPLTTLAMGRRNQDDETSFAAGGDSIANLKSLLQNLRPLKSGALWLDSGATSPVFHLELGRPE